jgi:hypothetical protein
VYIEITFSPYNVALPLSKTDKNEEVIVKGFDKSLGRMNDNFLNVFHAVLLLTVDCVLLSHLIIPFNVFE